MIQISLSLHREGYKKEKGPFFRVPAVLAFLGMMVLAPPADALQEVVLGEINPLTGRFAAQGAALHQGISYAVEEVNPRLALKGVKVAPVFRDDESKPERAVAAAEELVTRERALALVGGYVDSLVGPISEVAERAKVPYVASASLDERLTQRGYHYFFRVSSLPGYIKTTTDFLSEVLKVKNLAILYSTTPGATQLAQRQREILEKRGVKVPVFEAFTSGIVDFTPLLIKVREAGAEVILSDAFFADHLLMVRQLQEHRIYLKGFLGTFGMEFPAVIKRLGKASEYLLGTTSWEPEITTPGTEEASRAFVEGFKRRFGVEPDPLAMHGYASARAVLAALDSLIDKKIPVNGPNLREELSKLDLLLPLERLKFDPNGDPLGYERVVIQIQKGKHVPVYPPGRARGRALYPMPPWEKR